jgi:hypothetical protein
MVSNADGVKETFEVERELLDILPCLNSSILTLEQDPLESQGSLTLSQNHSLLFAVNAGSGNVSIFSVHKAALTFLNKTASGGAQPSAIAESGGLVYVLNSGGAGSLVGFHLDFGGQLKQIKDSTAFLTATTTGGASLAFSPDGQFLVVTERIANFVNPNPPPDGLLAGCEYAGGLLDGRPRRFDLCLLGPGKSYVADPYTFQR